MQTIDSETYSSRWNKIPPNSWSLKNVTNTTQTYKHEHSKIIDYLILHHTWHLGHVFEILYLSVTRGFTVWVIILTCVNVTSFRLNIKNDTVLCRCGGESLLLEAGNPQRRDYWLRRLRQERKSFAGRCMYLIQHRELWPHFALRGLVGILYVTQRKDFFFNINLFSACSVTTSNTTCLVM